MNNPFNTRHQTGQHDFEGVVYGLLGSCIWGAFMAVSSQGVNDGFSPEDLTFLRFLTAGLLLAPVLTITNYIGKLGWSRALILTLLAGPAFAIFTTYGLQLSPLLHGTVIQAVTLIVFSLMLMWWLTKERLGGSYLAGLLVLFVGLAAVACPALHRQSELLQGDALFIVAGMMWATFMVLIWVWRLDALAVTVVVSVLSALLYCPFYLLSHGPMHISMLDFDEVIEQLMIQGVLSGVMAVFAFSKSVQYLGVSRAALFPALSPAITMVLETMLFQQIPVLSQWIGFSVITAGLVLSFYRDPA